MILSSIGAKHLIIASMSKMCEKKNEDKKELKKEEVAYQCKKCGSTSNKEKKLCKPIKNK